MEPPTVQITFSTLRSAIVSNPMVAFVDLKLTDFRFEYYYEGENTSVSGVKYVKGNYEDVSSPTITATVTLYANKKYFIRTWAANSLTPSGVYGNWISFNTSDAATYAYQTYRVIAEKLMTHHEYPDLPVGYGPIDGALATLVSENDDVDGRTDTSRPNGVVYFPMLPKNESVNVTVTKAGYVTKSIFTNSIGQNQDVFIIMELNPPPPPS